MSIRNELLAAIVTAEGGTPLSTDPMDTLLSKAVVAAGGTVSQGTVRNSLLNDYLEAKGGTRLSDAIPRNTILCEILALLIIIDCDLPRNPLLALWQAAVEGNVFGDPWNDLQDWDDGLIWIE